LRWFR
jgi:uncharacterized protein YjbJ (UPF0337 family)